MPSSTAFAHTPTIPRLFHHVWPGRDPLRPRMAGWRATWMIHHPDAGFFWWRLDPPGRDPAVGFDPTSFDAAWIAQARADQALGLVEGDRWRRVRAVLNDPEATVVVKSDLLRWFAVLEYGGVYVDTDLECLRPLDALLRTPVGCFVGAESEGPRVVGASIVGAAPQHPFVREVLDEALHRVARLGAAACSREPHAITGPALVTAAVQRRPTQVTVYDPSLFYPVPYAQRHLLADRDSAAPRRGFEHAYAIHHWAGADDEGWTKKPNYG